MSVPLLGAHQFKKIKLEPSIVLPYPHQSSHTLLLRARLYLGKANPHMCQSLCTIVLERICSNGDAIELPSQFLCTV